MTWNGNSHLRAKDGSLNRFFHSNLYLSVLMEINKMKTKTCSKCGKEKAVTEFGVDNSRQDDLNGRCKKCHNLISRETTVRRRLGTKTQFLRPIAIHNDMHWCATCKKVHHKSKFNCSSTSKSGLNNSCKLSNSLAYKKSRKSLLEHKGIAYKHSCRMRAMKQNYGLTEPQFQDLMNLQKGVCKICSKDFGLQKKSAFVDHDHLTGDVRGLLCQQCNSLLGYARDDIHVLLKAATYLEIYTN